MKISALPANNAGYYPIPSAPLFLRDGYREYPPGPELSPFIRCFWEADMEEGAGYPVIPDTCADIIFKRSSGSGKVHAIFCGVNDAPFSHSQRKEPDKMYAIRFYAWAVSLFSGESLEDSVNLCCEAEVFFPGLVRYLIPILENAPSGWIPAAERWLYHARQERAGTARMMNSVYSVLSSRGRISMKEIASEAVLSPRQLQRVFLRETGLSPKRFSQLVRYQSLWQAAISPGFQILDAVERFGYTDQSHLLREFKRFHGFSLSQARRMALENVAFLQDSDRALW